MKSVRAVALCGAYSFALAAGWSSQALAQQSPTPPAKEGSLATDSNTTEDIALDEIVVTGSRPIAESEAAALNVQRKSDSIVAVAASDAVGRLPDQNIAQAASRLPGVAVERDQGQARYISLRGAPNYWTTLSFDGLNVVSPEGRDARFDSIPSAIAKQIIVSKAVTPDMPGETIAGNVNIVTRSAFDFRGLHFAGKVGAGIAEYGNRKSYEVSGVLSDRWKVGAGEIGALLSASYYQRGMITDNFENDYEQVSADRGPGYETRFWAHETENKLYRLTRKNYSFSGRLDYRPADGHEISLRSIYTIFTDDEARDNYRFDLDDRQGDLVANTADCTPTVNTTPTTSGYADVCIGNTPFQGTVYGIDIRQRSTLRAFRQSIFTNSLEGNHDFGGGWHWNWLGNFTRSKDDRSVVGEASWDSPSSRNLRPTVRYDFSDPDRSDLTIFRTIQLSSPTRYTAGDQVTDIDSFTKPLSSLTLLDAVDTTDAYTARTSIAKDLPLMGGEATIKAGFQFDQRTKTVDENQLVLNTAAQFAAAGISTNYTDFSLDRDFLGEIPLGYTFHYFDQDAMRDAADAAKKVGTFLPATGNIYDVRERVYAAYLMATLRYGWGSVVGGARFERVENRGIAEATVAGVTGQVTAKSDNSLVFPSLHFNYNLDDTKKLRLSFNSGAARADYDQLRPNVVVNDTNETISGGNPGVKPERAYGVDAYVEWYLRPQGYLMAGVFYKKVKDVLYTQRRPFGSSALDSNGVDRSGFVFSGITNGGDGRIFGAEVAAQLQLDPWTESLGVPAWLGGFGVSGNVTFNDSKVTKPAIGAIPNRKVRLPGTSDLVYNIGSYYEKYGLSLRLNYQFRSKWLDGIADDLAAAGDTYWYDDDELDFSARYAINRNVEVYVDGSNLLNKPGRRFSDPGSLLRATGINSPNREDYTIEWERFGRRYTAGVRVNF
ncbi:TonB-dependent receptor [Sphingomonas piscis]|uniref:TonB-dependent receptor n=1 Tax=Sphingomonas piscis TaxID=2714943 RepID=A0A6G7YMP5_9SPHN|nr:TonB-dependent receptor [Sphingomonas piscis]QIK78014.1 TonB-dependent receptor [Sphingomonas piscis]